jgi:hypothetical protein
VIAYLAAFATAVLYGVSAVIEDTAAKRVPTSGAGGRRSAVRATLSPVYLCGMVLSVAAWASALIALRSLPLFAVQSISASSIGVVVLITWIHKGHAPSRFEGALLVGVGIGLVALAVSATNGHALRTGWVFRWAIWAGVVAVVVMAIAASHVSGPRGTALLGGVSGLADSGLALCARAMHVHRHHLIRLLTDPLALALIPFAVIGIVAFAAAMQRGAASAALACQQAVVTVVPSAIGLAVLGDRARSGFIPLTIAGFAMTVVSLLVLTLSSTHRDDIDLFADVQPAAGGTTKH